MDNNIENININPVENHMSKKPSLVLIIVAVAVLALIIWWVNRSPVTKQAVVPTPTPPAAVVQDELQQEANDLDLGDVNGEFQEVDRDLNSL